MLLLERDGNICQGEGCSKPFNSLSDIRVDEIDGSEHHNCLRNKQLLHHHCNIKKGLRQKTERLQGQDYDARWLYSSYPSSRQNDCVCDSPCPLVHGYVSRERHTFMMDTVSVERNVEVRPQVHSIIPRDRQEMDDTADTDTTSENRSDTNWPKYALYFLLKVKLGYQFRATDAINNFAQVLAIRRGTVNNHYYKTMSRYFERDVKGNFMDVRKPDARPYLEESEIESLIAAHKRGTIHEYADMLALYQETLGFSYKELIDLFENAPALQKQTGK